MGTGSEFQQSPPATPPAPEFGTCPRFPAPAMRPITFSPDERVTERARALRGRTALKE